MRIKSINLGIAMISSYKRENVEATFVICRTQSRTLFVELAMILIVETTPTIGFDTNRYVQITVTNVVKL